MACMLRDIQEGHLDEGRTAYVSENPEKLLTGIGLEDATLQNLFKIATEKSMESAVDSQFKAKIAAYALDRADKTAAMSAIALPQNTREALTRKLFFGPMFTSGLLQHFIHMKSWTGRALAFDMLRLPGGTLGKFAEGRELTAAAMTLQYRNQLTLDWQRGWGERFEALVKSKGPLHWHKYIAGARDNTQVAQELWRELIAGANQLKIRKNWEWSSPEVKALYEHMHDTYVKMYDVRTSAGDLIDTSRRAPISFNKDLGKVLDQMGAEGVMEAIKRGGNANPKGTYNLLTYGVKKKNMSILGNSIQGEIDLSYSSNGASLMDAVDLNGWAAVDRDIHRVASATAMKKATRGLISTEEEWHAALGVVAEELHLNGVEPKLAKKQLQLLQDSWDSLSGNPIRGGLAPEVQMIRTAATNALLGTAGYAQIPVIGLSIASKLAGMAKNRGGTEFGHLLKNTGMGTELAKEIESLVGIANGITNLIHPVVVEELAGNLKYGALRSAGQFVLQKLTFAEYQNTIRKRLVQANFQHIISKYAAKFIVTQTVNDVARYYRGVATSMEHKRGVTGGFWEPTGPNPILKQIFDKAHYTPEGNLKNLNLGELESSEKAYLSALLTAEMDRISGDAAIAGEYPSWLNGLVAHSLMQFKDIGIKLTSSNGMATARYGDTDAVFEHLVATGLSSMLVYGRENLKEAVSGKEAAEAPEEYKDVVKHMFRLNDLMGVVSDTTNWYSLLEGAPQNKHLGETLMSEAPITSMVWEMYETGAAAYHKDFNGVVTHAAQLLPLKSVLMADTWAEAHWKPSMLEDVNLFKLIQSKSSHRTALYRDPNYVRRINTTGAETNPRDAPEQQQADRGPATGAI